jgi:hypothetical protein
VKSRGPSGTEQIQRNLDQFCLMRPLPGAEMNFDDDEIVLLLRLKRDEQPPASYYENFLSELRRRQRDELLYQSVWRICFERAQGFALRHSSDGVRHGWWRKIGAPTGINTANAAFS